MPRQLGLTRRAFTLVELLVAVGIISILISILIPSLSKARASANAARCASNLKQFATVWQMYANLNQGVSCPARLPKVNGLGVYGLSNGDAEYRPRWYELLGSLCKVFPNDKPSAQENDSWTISNRAFLCPMVDWNNSRNYPYGYNFQFLGNARRRVQGGFINWPVKASRIKAAQTVMAADCLGSAAGKPEVLRKGYYPDGTDIGAAVGNKAYLLDPPRLTAYSDYCNGKPSHNLEERSAPDPRHDKRVNVAFCDGHVALMSVREMGYVFNDEDRFYEPFPIGASNALFSGSGRDDDPPPAY
jgi:prepilin-type processing-associated H-X9-DG protein/prepilin-type N-terminal cleavage/methylation domain-containing protein